MQAVCILKQEKADWDTAKRVLGDSGFMRSLVEFDKDHIPDAVIKKLRKYTDSPDFTPEAVAKQSKAAQSLCMWCRAMEVYDRIAKVSKLHFCNSPCLCVNATPHACYKLSYEVLSCTHKHRVFAFNAVLIVTRTQTQAHCQAPKSNTSLQSAMLFTHIMNITHSCTMCSIKLML